MVVVAAVDEDKVVVVMATVVTLRSISPCDGDNSCTTSKK